MDKINLKIKKLNIKALDKEGNEKSLEDFKGKLKVISSFPKLNTSVCDNQTIKIVELAKQYKDVDFISITMDSVKTINKWCMSHSLPNLNILSDLKYGEFGKATNLLIKKMKMLNRGFIILNKDYKVLNYFYKSDIKAEPRFDELEAELAANI